jgi:hypothetical protein
VIPFRHANFGEGYPSALIETFRQILAGCAPWLAVIYLTAAVKRKFALFLYQPLLQSSLAIFVGEASI